MKLNRSTRIALPLLLLLSAAALAQQITTPDPRYKADILLVVAHPDDDSLVTSYLARAVYPDGTTHVLPLAHFLDHCEQGSIAVTIEMNAEGAIYPVAYARAGEEINEKPLPPQHLNDFTGGEYRDALESLL